MTSHGNRPTAASPLRFLVLWLLTAAPLVSAAQQPQSALAVVLSEQLIEQGRFEDALRAGQTALQAARKAGDRRGEAAALSALGNAYFYLGNSPRALDFFREALQKARELRDEVGEATELKNVGIAYLNMARLDEALEFLQRALDVSLRLNNTALVASSLENIGITYGLLGAHRLAFDFFEQTMEIANEHRLWDQMHHVLVDMGRLLLDLDQPDSARARFEEALAVAERENLFIGQSNALEGLSLAYAALGDNQNAISTADRCVALSRSLQHEDAATRCLWNLGTYHLQPDPALALSLLQQAVAAAGTREADLYWWELSTLGAAFLRLGQPDRALDYYERAVDSLDRHYSGIASIEHRASFLGRHFDTYTDLIELLLERHRREPNRGDDARAFHVFERSRARTIVEAVVQARAGIVEDADPGPHARASDLEAQVDDARRQLRASGRTSGERRRLLRQLDQAEQELDTWIEGMRRRNARLAALQYPQPLTLTHAQAMLDPSTALLAYEVSRKRVAVFAVTSSAFHAELLPVSPDVLAARVGSYLDLIAQDEVAGSQAIGRRLYRELIAPVAPHLSGPVQQLVVIPSGVLHFLPFEALISSGPGRPPAYLVDQFVVSYAPSATMLAELTPSRPATRPPPEADLIVFANAARGGVTPSAGVSLGVRALYEEEGLAADRLPFSAAEAKAISSYAGDGSRVLLDAEASEHQVKRLPLDRYRVIHFATHGLVSQRAPARSSLVLAPGSADEDGFLQAREIYGLKLAAELVVLSGCQTARGAILAGEGVQGLARACFYAGAQAVLASLWNVNDRGTARFMDAFYKHLADGESKARALRSAKLQVLRDTPEISPRHWAAFVLIGHPDGVVPLQGPGPGASRTWLVVTLLAVGLTLLAALLAGRRRPTR